MFVCRRKPNHMKVVLPNRQISLLLENVAHAATLVAVVAFGLSRLFQAKYASEPADTAAGEPGNPDEMNTTEYLLSGLNRAQILAALERRRQNHYVVHDLPVA